MMLCLSGDFVVRRRAFGCLYRGVLARVQGNGPSICRPSK